MKFSYYRSTCEVTPTSPEAPEAEIIGKYRGLPVFCKSAKGVSQPQAVTRLSYRGVEYVRIR